MIYGIKRNSEESVSYQVPSVASEGDKEGAIAVTSLGFRYPRRLRPPARLTFVGRLESCWAKLVLNACCYALYQ